MLENYARIREFPALPRLRMAHIEEYFAALPESGLPVWVGELYLEFHRGTLTTQATHESAQPRRRAPAPRSRSLRGHRPALRVPLSARRDRVRLEDAPAQPVPRHHPRLLHRRGLPGHRPGAGRGRAHGDRRARCGAGAPWRTGARTPHPVTRLIVANAALAPRPLTVLLAGQDGDATVTAPDGATLPTQPVEEGLLVHDPARSVPGLGWLNLSVAARRSSLRASAVQPLSGRNDSAGGAILENDLLRVEIGDDGTLHRVVDKAAGDRDVLADRGNQLWAFVDKPRTYDAWDIEENYEDEGEEIGGVEAIEVVETGPLRGAVRVRRAWRDSRIEQTYRLLSRLAAARHRHPHRLARAADLPASALPAGRAQPRGDLRDVVRRDPPPDPPQHVLGRRPLRGQRTSLRRSLRTGLRRGAAQRREIRLLRARQRPDAQPVAQPALSRPRRGRRPSCLHLQPFSPSGRLDRGQCRRRSVRAQLAADRRTRRGRRSPGRNRITSSPSTVCRSRSAA